MLTWKKLLLPIYFRFTTNDGFSNVSDSKNILNYLFGIKRFVLTQEMFTTIKMNEKPVL